MSSEKEFDIDAYRIATDDEKRDYCADEYDLLLGPNEFSCCLTEPEDRNFHRDLAPLVKLLNQQHLEIRKGQEQAANRDEEIARRAFEAGRAFIYERDESGQYDIPQETVFKDSDDYINSGGFKKG